MERVTKFIKKIQTAEFISAEDSKVFNDISISLGDDWRLLDELNLAVSSGQLSVIKEIEEQIRNVLTES